MSCKGCTQGLDSVFYDTQPNSIFSTWMVVLLKMKYKHSKARSVGGISINIAEEKLCPFTLNIKVSYTFMKRTKLDRIICDALQYREIVTGEVIVSVDI